MIPTQALKTVVFKNSATVASDATSSTSLDTQGYAQARVIVISSPALATNASQTLTSIVLLHSETTDISSATAITGSTGFTIPVNNSTSLSTQIAWDVNLTNLERYLHVKLQASSSGTVLTGVGILARGEQAPNSATEAGVDAQVVLNP